MITFAACVAFIIIFIIMLSVFATTKVCSNEQFDTYYQHDKEAATVYDKPLDQAGLLAKYKWSLKNKFGYNLYDQAYNNVVDRRWDLKEKFSKGYLNERDGDYDTKFNVDKPAYSISQMAEPQQQIEFRGIPIQLSQRLVW